MTTIIIFLAFWLAPCIPVYVIAAWYTKDWKPVKKDWLLLVPVLNWIMLGFVLCILFDELLTKIKY